MEAVAGVRYASLMGVAERIRSRNSESLTVVLSGLAKLSSVLSVLPTPTRVLFARQHVPRNAADELWAIVEPLHHGPTPVNSICAA